MRKWDIKRLAPLFRARALRSLLLLRVRLVEKLTNIESDGHFSMSASPVSICIALIAVSFGFVVGAGTWIYNDHAMDGSILFLGASYVLASVATQKVKVYGDRIDGIAFWRVKWSVWLQDAKIESGRGGDFALVPAIIVSNVKTGKRVGYILKSQFRAQDIEKFQSILAAMGVEIGFR